MQAGRGGNEMVRECKRRGRDGRKEGRKQSGGWQGRGRDDNKVGGN